MTTSNQLPANSREVDCAEVVIAEVSKDILDIFFFRRETAMLLSAVG